MWSSEMAIYKYLFLFTSLFSHSSCETKDMEGYHFIESLQSFYQINTAAKSWEVAKLMCKADDAAFFYPKNKAEADAVLAYAKDTSYLQQFWIGMYATPNRTFITTDGLLSTDVYNVWNAGEPNNSNKDEYCVELLAAGLNDVTCSAERPYICKKTKGLAGYPEVPGSEGHQCVTGLPGYPGNSGVQIAPAKPGSSTTYVVCPTTCQVIQISESSIYHEGKVPQLGSEDRPSAAICKFVPASADKEVPAPNPYWVMEEEKFPVKCDKHTKSTCLILTHNDTKWINENQIYIGNGQQGRWLSKYGFSLSRFNTITHSQLHWLKEQSTNVRQTIRFYFKNTTFERITLWMLNNNDVLFGQSPSAYTPMYYSVENYPGGTVEVNGETWKFIDLVIIDNVNRLPVVDFYVAYKPSKNEHLFISVQLRELCFA